MADDEDLYARPPEEFTAAREALVKQARAGGDRPRAQTLAGLRRPTASAYAVNALVRAQPDLIEQLLSLGAALGAAQQEGRGADLQALGGQRRELIEAVTDAATAAAGRELAAAARAEVVGTLEAALADPASGEAVRTGRLVRALSFAGFGGVDLDGAVASVVDPPARTDGAGPAASPPAGTGPGDKPTKPSTKPSTGRASTAKAEQEAAKLAAAEQASLHAHGALDDAVRAHELAAREAAAAEAEHESAQQEATAAREAVTAAEQALGQARELLVPAEQREKRAVAEAEKLAKTASRKERTVTAAQDAAEQARAALDALRRA